MNSAVILLILGLLCLNSSCKEIKDEDFVARKNAMDVRKQNEIEDLAIIHEEENKPIYRTKRFLDYIIAGIKEFGHLVERCNPFSRSYNCLGINDHREEPCGLVILQALAIKFPPEPLARSFVASQLGLGVRKNCIIKYPDAPTHPTLIFPPTFLSVLGVNIFKSWFNFWMLPGISVISSLPGESKEHLDSSLQIIERNIEELIDEGVPSENIVVMGFSQGGAMTIYTALHSRHKIGGFVPVIAWLPLRNVEPITELRSPPVNQYTPILQVNGMLDPLVAPIATTKTAEDLAKVFPNYQLHTSKLTTHSTTVHPGTLTIIKQWLRKYTNIAS